MTHRGVHESFPSSGNGVVRNTHDGKCTKRASILSGIVLVMIFVGVLPDGRRTQHKKAVEPQDRAGHPGIAKNRSVHIVVINYEQPHQDQTADDAAGHANGQWKFHAGQREQCTSNGDC